MNIVIRLLENADLDASEHEPDDVVQMQYDAADEIEHLRAELAHAKLFMPAQRTEQQLEPVKAIGPCNFEFWRIVESDEEFAERAGAQIQEVDE